MNRKFSFVIGIALSVAGCTSATKRYQQGEELAREGRPADAADRYIQALKKDGRLDSARAGLRTSGAAAITQDLNAATGADPVAGADGAADAYIAIDDLRRRALEVGVDLAVPTDYADRRRPAFDRAIAADLADARALTVREQFDAANARLVRTTANYQPNATQRDALDGGRADAILGAARADMSQGRFRSAYERADAIVSVVGTNRPQANQARNLQADALSQGTRRAVIMPMWATVSAKSQLPDEALPALSDALLESPWTAPPRFIEVVAPPQVDRDLRRLDLSRRTLSTNEAARFGREVRADYVVVAEIDSVHRDEVNVKATRHAVRTIKGVDTAYTVEEGRVRLFVRATYVLIDPEARRWADHQSVVIVAEAPFTRGRFAGDTRSLDLRQNERDLFDRGVADGTEHELVRSLVATMSPRYADAVYGELLRRIP